MPQAVQHGGFVGNGGQAQGQYKAWAGKTFAAQYFTAVPFGLNFQGMNAWLYHGGGLKLWEEVYAPFDLVPLPMGNTGVQMGGWYRKEIKALADLEGVKMRIGGFAGQPLQVFQRFLLGFENLLLLDGELPHHQAQRPKAYTATLSLTGKTQ